MSTERDAAQIKAEIEQAVDQLALTIDQLTTRLAPQRLVDQAKAAVMAKVQSPTGKKVIAGTGVVLAIVVVRNYRRSRRG